MTEIPVHQYGSAAVLHARVDDRDAAVLMLFKWFLVNGTAITRPWHGGKPRPALMARMILGLTKDEQHMRVIYRDGDKLNCQRTNLKIVTHGDAMRQFCYSRQPLGVAIYNAHQARKDGSLRWQAYVTYRGKRHRLGVFSTKEEAAAVSAAFRRDHIPFRTEA